MSNLSPKFALLGFLLDGQSHGYDLHQKLQAELGNVWRLSQSQAYAILKRLEARGDVTVKPLAQDKLPARQIIRITKSGKMLFDEWLYRPSKNARAIRLEFLTRLYFTQHRADKIARIYSAQHAEVLSGITRLEKMLAHLPPNLAFNRMSLDLRIRQLRIIQDWLEDIKEEFGVVDEAFQ